MTSKNKKRHERPAAAVGGGLRQEVERLIAKEHLKDAVKQAKLCFRENPTQENHYLLERAYFLRADQLGRDAMPTSAREVAFHLLEFGVTDPTLLEQAIRLLISLGMSREARVLQGKIDSPEVLERFVRIEADLAVVHPERATGATEEIRQGGQLIRDAIEAVQGGDETKGLESLQGISRGSPFADWRVFARGLAAKHRGEAQETLANWDRLDPDRAAARIVRALRGLAPPSPGEAGTTGKVKLEALESRVFGVAVLEPLEQLRTFLAENRWDRAIRQAAALRHVLSRIDPALAVRLTRILCPLFIQEVGDLGFREAKARVKEFTAAVERLPIDPQWNRFWALLWEEPQGGPDDAEDSWRKYLKDLETIPSLTPEERVLARALVLKHLGENRVDEAKLMADAVDAPFGPRPSQREIKVQRDLAVACFEESLKLLPTHRPTFRALLEAYQAWDRVDDGAAVARRLLKSFPDDFDAASWLSMYHFKRQEPEPALELARQARALKPLDATAVENEWAIQILRARDFALKGRWDEGRAAFEAADQLLPERSGDLHLRARRAIFELKAGQPEPADALIAVAQEGLPEATPLWLALLIEAIRYQLPKADRDRFEARWTAAVSKKVRGETAGALATLIAPFVAGQVDYKGRDGHIKDVVDYLRRTTRIKYAHDNLAQACSLISLLDKEKKLFETLVKRGLKLFPNSPLFLMFSGALELQRGPLSGGNLRLAREQLEKALRLVSESSNPMETRLLPQIRESLSMLKDISSATMGMPFPGRGGGFPGGSRMGDFGSYFEIMMGEMLDDEEDDEFNDEWDDEPPRLPSSAPRAKSAGPKSAKPKKKKG